MRNHFSRNVCFKVFGLCAVRGLVFFFSAACYLNSSPALGKATSALLFSPTSILSRLFARLRQESIIQLPKSKTRPRSFVLPAPVGVAGTGAGKTAGAEPTTNSQ